MPDSMKLLTILLALLAGCAGLGFSEAADSPQSASGVVLDTSGAAIVGAEVILKQQDAVVSQTSTDNAGSFYFPDLTHGSYQIVVRHSGFRETLTALEMGAKPI